jgi:hypothetical protein
MAAPASTRFTMTVKSLPRILLSVREQNNGRLIVTIQGAGNKTRDLGIPAQAPGRTDRHNVRIAHQKFSMHPSTLSATHNQLHFHQISGDGKKRNEYHVTNAITSKRFAPLFIKRYSALKDPSYDLKKGNNVINLGNYDVSWFSLILCVLVAHKDCAFTEKSYDVSTAQQQFRDFRLVILWSFFTLPATDFSMVTGFATLRPEEALNDEDRKMRERLMAGLDAHEAISMFISLRDGIRDEGIATAQQFVPEAFAQNPETILIARCRYFRSGEYTNKVVKAIKAKTAYRP